MSEWIWNLKREEKKRKKSSEGKKGKVRANEIVGRDKEGRKEQENKLIK